MSYKNLQLLGLTPEEIAIYKTLCKEQSLTLTELSRKSEVNRPRLYQLLPEMVKKQIVLERTIGKRTHYRPAEPRNLYNTLTQYTNDVMAEIDELQGEYESVRKKPDIEFHIGTQGYQKMFDDIADVVPRGGQILRYSARRPDDTTYKVSPAYRKRRNKGHFERLAITSVKKGAKANLKRLDKHVKVIPAEYDSFEDHVSQTIYEDRVVFTDHENETVFILKSAKIAAVQKKLFKLLWKHLPSPKQ